MARYQSPEYKNGIIQMQDIDEDPDPRGAGCLFFDIMSQNKTKIAQIEDITNETDTYENLLDRCIRTAVVMRNYYDVKPGDIISICSVNHLNSIVPLISSLFLGSTVSSFDPALSLAETINLFVLVRPKLIFVSIEGLELIEQTLKNTEIDTKIVVFGQTNKWIPFSKFLEKAIQVNDFVPHPIVNNAQNAFILFSSGTSGLPKGLCISHYSYIGQIRSICYREYIYSRILSFATSYWSSTIVFVGYAILNGITRVLVPKFDAVKVWNVIHRHKVEFMFTSPYQIITLNNTKLLPDQDISSLKSIIIGGGPLSADRLADVRKSLPTVQVSLTYGSSESGFTAMFQHAIADHAKNSKEKLTSCGVGLKGFSFKIVNPENEKVLNANEHGELRIKSKYLLSGYYQLNSSDIWDSDGWLKTGDIGYYDDEFCIYVVDRIKEMLKFRSFRVLPATIENVLYTHPAVKYAVVTGISDEHDGDHPCAAIVLHQSHGNTTTEELMKYVEEKLGDMHKLRGGIRFIDKVPLSATGKISRKAVQAMFVK